MPVSPSHLHEGLLYCGCTFKNRKDKWTTQSCHLVFDLIKELSQRLSQQVFLFLSVHEFQFSRLFMESEERKVQFDSKQEFDFSLFRLYRVNKI